MSKVAIIDFGAGNIHSISSAVNMVTDREVVIVKEATQLNDVDIIILPGVGAFNQASDAIFKVPDLVEMLKKKIIEEKLPFLGICIGMQLLAEYGYENGKRAGLAFIDGEVDIFPKSDLKIPHMGWNEINIKDDIKSNYDLSEFDGLDFYFVHSYYLKTTENIAATTNYITEFPAIIAKDNIIATQFHPEKSGENGLKFLARFLA